MLFPTHIKQGEADRQANGRIFFQKEFFCQHCCKGGIPDPSQAFRPIHAVFCSLIFQGILENVLASPVGYQSQGAENLFLEIISSGYWYEAQGGSSLLCSKPVNFIQARNRVIKP